MTEKVKQIIEDSLPITFNASQVAEEIAQMFCDKFMAREYDFVSGLESIYVFCECVKGAIDSWSSGTGFTEQQIINSLEKLKNGDK